MEAQSEPQSQHAPIRDRRRILLTLIGLFCVPVLVCTLYLTARRATHLRFTPLSDYTFLALSILAGLPFIVALPMRRAEKLVLTIAYIPFSYVALFYYTLVFVCLVFGDCL